MPLNFLSRQYYQYLLSREFPLRKYEGAVKLLHYYDYIEWDEKHILTTIQNRLDWRAPESSVSSWRFDCRIHALVNYLTEAIFGFTEEDELYSRMIRDGKMAREEALLRLEKEKEGEKAESHAIRMVFDRLGLSHKERQAILASENLTCHYSGT
jgi:hypothetical protein